MGGGRSEKRSKRGMTGHGEILRTQGADDAQLHAGPRDGGDAATPIARPHALASRSSWHLRRLTKNAAYDGQPITAAMAARPVRRI